MGIEVVVLVVYGLALLFIFLYSLIQIQLVFHYLRTKSNVKEEDKEPEITDDYPFVSIQLPVYNEKYVIERLVRNISEFDYPKDRFEIQILDDSDDETTEIINSLIVSMSDNDLDISHLRRDNRIGYKAGALAEGLKSAKGDLIAIFDADFLPEKDFLKRTVVYFKDQEIGMVQSRWRHLNEKYNWLTRLQAFGLDAHFSVEQVGRNKGGHFINFNGTAGIWRKSCIINAGGWSADTLTEDLDLSYRAQMKGWKFKYLENLGSPAELPAQMNALKTQQYRWTKGAAECSRKNLGSLLMSNKFGLQTKINGIFHLLNSSIFICIVIASLLSIPVLLIKHNYSQYDAIFRLATVFFTGIFFLAIFYFTSYKSGVKSLFKALILFVFKFPLFLSVSMGLSLHNGLAAFEGLIGKKTPFIRTPKFNIISNKDKWQKNQYVSGKLNKMVFLEMLLVFYFCAGIYLSFQIEDFGLLPFLIMLAGGYSFVSFLSIKHAFS